MATKAKTAKEIAAFSFYTGLCSTCVHAESCCNRKAAGGDVMYCDMFDDAVQTSAEPTRPVIRAEAVPNGSSAAKGLCGNCEYHGNCSYESPRGVWYCEQYQ